MSSPWKEIALTSAAEFLAVLSPTSDAFVSFDPNDWVFRGHSDANWGLQPSSFREHPLLMDPLVSDPFGDWSNSNQFAAEFHALIRFFEACDARALSLPEDTQHLRLTLRYIRHLRVAEPHEAVRWPPSDLWSLLALAQHYGVPTRLLDWTRDSYTAAYFAAVGVLEGYKSDRLAVWAYCSKFDAAGVLAERISTYKHPVQLITAPYAGNPNLAAQRGVHILLNPDPLNPDDPAFRYDVTDALASVHAGVGSVPLLKFTAPSDTAPDLLRLLAKHGTTPASLFPGYAGVVAAMLQEEKWASRKRPPSYAYSKAKTGGSTPKP